MVDDSEKQVKEEVQAWLKEAKSVIEEMADIEEKVQNVSYLSRGSLGRRVRQKIQDVREIYDRGIFPEGLVIKRPPTIGITLPIENMVGEVDVKEKIWEYLMSQEVGIIGVCGIGGVGKTTIMKHIHNELLNEVTRFEKVIWVTVSHPLNVFRLQGDIARRMNKSLPDYGDELNRASKLMEVMKTVKYALILDDVWDKFTFQRVGIPEPTMGNGCKIVITSRSVDICNYLRCQMVKVPPLLEKESLNLFLDKVGQDVLQIANLEEILKLIVAECAGLPLAIVVIAGSMRGVKDIFEWRNALRELRQCVVDTEKDSEDQIFKRLKFSYDRLRNFSIQNCFLYCSLYPEDWDIRREDLIENWICEGLIEKLGSRREMHDKGNVILNRLLNNFLLEKANREACVKMHDVVRDMALRIKSIGPSKFMVKAKMGLTEIPEENEWTEDLEKISLMRNDISYVPENMSPKCSMLSTLILEGNERLRKIPDCFFSNMPLLKFLILSHTNIEVLPNSLCNLENLTALILHGCWRLERMPSLAKLKALKKLDLYGAGLLVVPEGIEMLEQLQYLDLSCPGLKEVPTGMISNLSRLQYLRRDKLSTEEILRGEVATLKKLENFEGCFSDRKAFNYFVSKSKHFLGGLNHYVLEVGGNGNWSFNLFQPFHYNYCFKKVILVKCEIRGEDDLGLPDDLQVLSVEDCDTVGDISIFMKNTTQLQSYSLEGCQGIECVVSSSSLTVMNNLEVLYLLKLDSLRDLVKLEKTKASLAPTISPHIFSYLKELRVVECSKLNKLFPCELLQGQCLQNLEEIHVEDCFGMEEIIGWEEEAEEEGNQTITTAVFPFPKLKSLYLDYLPELKRICPARGVMVCDSLNSICIKSCPEVKKIPLCLGRKNGQPSLPALKAISIDNPKKWWESVGWENPDDKNVLLPFLQYVSPGTWVRVSYTSVGLRRFKYGNSINKD